jgi:hypothetical protein
MKVLSMKEILQRIFVISVFLSPLASAEVAPVTIASPKAKALTGERLPFFIELHARGSFVGTATFSIPQIPDTIIMKVGSPVISSKQIEGEEWFVQRHEFNLFSQRNGKLEIPAIPIRFSAREGFTGDAKDFEEKSEALALTIERPPGSEKIGYLVTTSSLEITEKWDPAPETAEVGSVFKRTISQRAAQMTGMALAPAPTQAPEGTRLYPGRAEIIDKTERGDFTGERSETITYLIEKSGTVTLPAITFNWWNASKQKLEAITLPAVSFEVPAPPPSAKEEAAQNQSRLIHLLSFLILLAAIVWKRKLIDSGFAKFWKKINPPDRVAARHFLSACRKNDPAAATTAWSKWQNTTGFHDIPDPALRSEILVLQGHIFGSENPAEWKGAALAEAFRSYAKSKPRPKSNHSALLPLNPKSPNS